MWFPSLSSIAAVATAIHLVFADGIEARDGKKTDKNAFTEPVDGTVDSSGPITVKWKVSRVQVLGRVDALIGGYIWSFTDAILSLHFAFGTHSLTPRDQLPLN